MKTLQKSKIKSIVASDELTNVYDISVKDDKHYILGNNLISHNSGPVYAASIVVVLQKRKLKEDENGVKISEVTGIRSAVHVEKSRYAKPFEKCELHIPYETGMSPYTGMFDYLYEKTNVLKRVGNRYEYIDNSGVAHTYFRKDIPTSLYDLIMSEWDSRQKPKAQVVDEVETIDPETGEIL